MDTTQCQCIMFSSNGDSRVALHPLILPIPFVSFSLSSFFFLLSDLSGVCGHFRTMCDMEDICSNLNSLMRFYSCAFLLCSVAQRIGNRGYSFRQIIELQLLQWMWITVHLRITKGLMRCLHSTSKNNKLYSSSGREYRQARQE